MDENLDINLIEVPEWHIDIVRMRLVDYDANPEMALDFNEVMNRLEKKFQ